MGLSFWISHNLYCHLHNFEVAFDDIINLYPLERVREIHISGGSWEASTLLPHKKIRRDTHDGAVPKEVFFLLEQTINKCPNLKYVVLEQLGNGLNTIESQQLFQKDFLTLEQIVQHKNNLPQKREKNTFLPNTSFQLGTPKRRPFTSYTAIRIIKYFGNSYRLSASAAEIDRF